MSKKILVIESDDVFRGTLAQAIGQRGFTPVQSGDSEAGLQLAKAEQPDLIVACVEAKPTNGYIVCTRIKKDQTLQNIPVILTSATATPDAFEKHKQLKTHAEAYLSKPFEADALVAQAEALIGPAAPDAEPGLFTSEEEAITLADLDVDEPVAVAPTADNDSGDSDQMLNQAWGALELETPAVDMPPAAATGDERSNAAPDLSARVAELEAALAQKAAELEEARGAQRPKTSDKDLLRLRAQLAMKEAELAEQSEKVTELEAELAKARATLQRLRKALE